MHELGAPVSRLPSLDLLKGFDAAARHLSFTRGAEDLFLTQSALSRQIQTLEEQLGVALFERRHRELRLTDAGQILHTCAKNVLDELAHAVAKIRREQSTQPLTVSTNQPFAAMWLIPRLSQFRELHPDVDVFISADNRIVDLERERIDLAVRYCTEAMAPPGSPRLFGERLVPVCSPSLAADRERPLKRPEDLARHTLLHIDDERGRFPWLNWSVWLAAIGIRDLEPAGSLRFNHFDQVMQAALGGQGVALGRVPLIDSLLRERRLVAPFRDKYATSRAYFVVTTNQASMRPAARAFVEWLCEEARAEVEAPAAGKSRAKPSPRARPR
ncbi:MAG: transcriptional regulator GcvA [Betaproteobacteria bacterium]|nr:MAG: transcriptional regulator GcvA [Betaproteobacteria bacterium]